MRDVIVFNGASNLDFQEIRTNVTRIPEVLTRIREAQELWDKLSSSSLDLANFIASEDSIFLGNIRLKAFATAVVQIGLYDRYLKTHDVAAYIVGACNGDSPLCVAVGTKTFAALVAESAVIKGSGRTGLTAMVGGELPVLSGVQLTEYAAYQKTGDAEFTRLPIESLKLDKILFELIEESNVSKVILIGPGNTGFNDRAFDLAGRDIQLLESIDTDPLLSWFWTHIRDSRLDLAN